MDNAKVHTATAVSTFMPDLRLKRTAVHRTSSFRHAQLTDADQLFDALDAKFTSLSAGTIEDVFRNWIHQPEQVIELNGDYFGSRFSDIDNTVLKWAEDGQPRSR
jgi:hypothetical protein